MSTMEIAIRSIQHYLYCPHRWGLMEIDRAWAENAFVTKANLMHGRVHDPDRAYSAKGKKVYTSVPVYNDLEEYNLYGVTDCLELTKSRTEVPMEINIGKNTLNNRAKQTPRREASEYNICIVEYKPTKPKNADYNEDDLMQVFAQKICVDYVFGGDCDSFLYYADVKKRIRLPLRENFEWYDSRLREVLQEMRRCFARGIIPPVRKGQKCSGCSMKDLCMPSVKKPGDLLSEIRKIQEGEIS